MNRRRESFGDALTRALTGRSPATGRFGAPALSELERAAGGARAAAQLAGVSPETWRRWKHGTQRPRAASVDQVEAAVRQTRLKAGRRDRLLSGTPTMTMDAVVRISSDERERKINLSEYATASDLAELVAAYDSGDADQAEAVANNILDQYVPGMTVINVHSLTIGVESE